MASKVSIKNVADRILVIFEDCEPVWLNQQIQALCTADPSKGENAIMDIMCEVLMNDENYPRKPKVKPPTPRASSTGGAEDGVVDLTVGADVASQQIKLTNHRPKTVAEILETFPDCQQSYVESFYDRLKNQGVELFNIAGMLILIGMKAYTINLGL